jgi:hypothetical protein
MPNDDVNRHDAYSTPQPAKQVIDAIASYCGRADRNGKDWKCNCPICGRHSLSISRGFKIPILIRCWYCKSNGLNDGYTEQCGRFIEAGLLPPDARTIAKFTTEEYRQYHKVKREAAARHWEKLRPIKPDDEAAKYLQARGLESFTNHPALRSYSGYIGFSVGTVRPVLAARLWHVEHGLCAVQFTYLNWSGSDRDREVKPGRQTLGSMKGGAVWIGAPRFDQEVVVAEGLETLLSAMLLLKLKCGAAMCGPHMEDLVLPSGVRSVRIAADNDDTGRGAAEHTIKLWRNRGLKVRVSYPEIVGKDFNDVLMAQ